MKKLGIIMLAGAAAVGLAAAAGGAMAPQPSMEQVRVEPARSSKPIQQNQTPSERQMIAMREDEARRHVRAIRSTASHKNRRPGERAHRRWRFRKASGRAA